MNIKIFANKEKFARACAQFITRQGARRSKHKPPFHIALSGGSTVKPVYKAVVRLDKKLKASKSTNTGLPWRCVELWQVDERYVPKTSQDSNARLIREYLIKNLEQPPRVFHTWDTALPLEKCLKKYEEELLPQFDLTVLGIGADGHTASLFPHSAALKESRPVAHTQTPPPSSKKAALAVRDRLTLTFPAIMQSKKILVMLSGKEKAGVLEKLTNPKTTISETPAKKLTDHPDITVYYCKS